MKSLLTIVFIFSLLTASAQWNNNSDNQTTGNLTIGSSTDGSYSHFTIIGPNVPQGINSKRQINFDFASAGDAVIRAYRGLSWDSHIQFLTSEYNNSGGAPSVRLHIHGSGNIGIGTTDPQKKLQIEDGSNMRVSAGTHTGEPAIFLSRWMGAGSNYQSHILHTSWNGTGHGLAFSTVGTHNDNDFGAYDTKMYLTQFGSLGLGTTTPLHNLEITDNSGFPSLGIRGSADSKIVFEPEDGSDRFTIWSDMDHNTYLDLLRFGAGNWPDILTLQGNGNVGIGTIAPDAKLTVKGDIHTREVRVDMDGPLQGPDYVFEKDYNLLPLSEIEAYINQNKHLPEVPSAKEMEANGLNLKEMNLLLLKKVEELTLHLIEQNQKWEKQQKQLEGQQKDIERLKSSKN